jgi:chromosome partitioning protein
MGQTLCIASLKGGVGKTTTAVNLSAAFAALNKRTLLIDCDQQGSATVGLGINKKRISKTLYDGFSGNASAMELARESGLGSLEIIPSNESLLRVELDLLTKQDSANMLRRLIETVKADYDYLVIDTPPSMGLLSLNALTAADSLLIPLQCEFLAYESLTTLLWTIRLVRERFNSGLKLAGILLTMHDAGNNISHRIERNIRKNLRNLVFGTLIPRSEQLSESPSRGKPILVHDPASVGAQNYLDLAREIMGRGLDVVKKN